MAALKHVHSYIQWKRKGPDNEMWWKCDDPGCTHTMIQSLVQGKNTLCPECKITVFILDWKDDLLRRAVPKCINCRNTAIAREHKAIGATIKDLFPQEKT